MKKVIVSACLLGEYCRYDGKTKRVNGIVDAYKGYEIIPFCPEAPLFGTPRERIALVATETKIKVMTEETKKDVTALLEEEILAFCHKHTDIDAIVLKSKSPSCGNQTTPILYANGEVMQLGDGIATQIFKKKYEKIPFYDETDLE